MDQLDFTELGGIASLLSAQRVDSIPSLAEAQESSFSVIDVRLPRRCPDSKLGGVTDRLGGDVLLCRKDVEVVVPPVFPVDSPALGATIIADMARSSGWTASVVYAPLMFSPDSDALAYSVATPTMYRPIYRDTALDNFSDQVVDALSEDAIRVNEWPREKSFDNVRPYLQRLFADYGRQATRVVCDVAAGITALRPAPAVVALSITVDAQKLPGAAIAAELRRRGYSGIIMAGGSALDGGMGLALLRSFAEFDAVLLGEAESNWLDFLGALSSDWSENEVIPGLTVRRGDDVRANPTAIPSSLWELGGSAFDQFTSQFSLSGRGDPVALTAESSRGCWWADRQRCTFCAVDPVAHPYRTHNETYVANFLSETWKTWHPLQINMTDSCMPRLRHSRIAQRLGSAPSHNDWALYYEVKSTLTRAELAQLKEIGLTEIQPGIESFSTETLRDFRKGATRLQHVNLLKWSQAYGLRVTYPIIYGSPYETADRLHDMVQLMGLIHHLSPPMRLNRLRLYRGSFYWQHSGDFDFQDATPLECDRLAYGLPDDELMDLVFQCNYTCTSQRSVEYLIALDDLTDAWVSWRQDFAYSRLVLADSDDAIVITRTDPSGATISVIDRPEAMGVLRACQEVANLERVRVELGLDKNVFVSVLQDLEADGLIIKEGGRALTLPIPLQARSEIP
ncbi:MAG: RiPP maturation radical SAM C-methyltransferase [Propionibacteriaceae bacterium]|jgi:ribosomal peptide maturation radical SAM protein 1|nr:RiPP maturation radical SAM C-methyltransferase [Propionibacteriaceae bacterium]